MCRRCGALTDIDCAADSVPCLEPSGLDRNAPGFVVDEAEVTYWGVCQSCSTRAANG